MPTLKREDAAFKFKLPFLGTIKVYELFKCHRANFLCTIMKCYSREQKGLDYCQFSAPIL